jgi:VWFA-related protein
VAPSGSCSVKVRFKPTVISTVAYTDSFDISSNDLDQPSLTVSVSGDARGLNVAINKVDTSAVLATGGLVRLLVSVTDGNNNPINGLGIADFSLSEGGLSQLITGINNAISPVSASLVLDYSYSVLSVQDDIEESAKLFLRTLNVVSDEAGVIKFASEVREAIGFTPISNITALDNAIDAPYTDPTNATKLFDAVVLATDKLMVRPVDNRRCAIVVSDGEDIINSGPASTADLEDVIADALDNKVFIFTIGLGNPIITDVLQPMAARTGGQYFETPDSTELNTIYAQITQILNGQYEITFTTAKADGSLNSLRVLATQPVTLLTGEDTESVTY